MDRSEYIAAVDRTEQRNIQNSVRSSKAAKATQERYGEALITITTKPPELEEGEDAAELEGGGDPHQLHLHHHRLGEEGGMGLGQGGAEGKLPCSLHYFLHYHSHLGEGEHGSEHGDQGRA